MTEADLADPTGPTDPAGALSAACVETVMAAFLVIEVDPGSERVVSVFPGTAQALGLDPQQLLGLAVGDLLGRELADRPRPQPQPGWTDADDPLLLTAPGTVRVVRLIHRAKARDRVVLILRDQSEAVATMAEWRAELKALTAGQLQLEFTPSGHVLHADPLALRIFGYAADQLIGLHHQVLCESGDLDPDLQLDLEHSFRTELDLADALGSAEGRDLWSRLVDGETVTGNFRRMDALGRTVWLRGQYIPIPGLDGRLAKVTLIARQIDAELLRQSDLEGKVAAIERSQAVVEFDLDGTILAANDNFLQIMDYDRSEVIGFHHQIFVDPDHAQTPEYRRFWEELRQGRFVSGEFHRIARDGRDIWLQATYNPVLDPAGKPWKVVKYALDITAEKNRTAEFEGKVTAIDRSQAVVEFGLDGTVITANQNFLAVMGYDLEEVVGNHHRMFLAKNTDPAAYEEFWRRLRAGDFVTGEFQRRSRDGRDVWLRATYNPVLDPDGRPWKVIKYALDVTAEKARNADYAGKMAAIDRSQLVIEFDTGGTILGANQNFLDLLGYQEQELVGQHHRLLVRPDEVADAAYQLFWDRLARGEYDSGEYRRITKDGREVWIRATYNPVLGPDGTPYKIVKFANDVTGEKLRSAEYAGRLAAIDRAQAVAEFDLNGKLLSANENFQRIMGYAEEEILGQPHSMFCTRDYVTSAEYRDFWMRLRKGELISGRFHRMGKFGRDVWIQSSYNPILDLNGNPVQVIKYAYDVTAYVQLEEQLAIKGRALDQTARRLSEVTGSVAERCTRSDMTLSQLHDEARQGSASAPAALASFSRIQATQSQIGEVGQILADLARESNQAAFTLALELSRDIGADLSPGVQLLVEEARLLANRSSQAAREITRLVEDTVLEVNQGSDAARRAEITYDRVSATVTKARANLEQAAELVRNQQLLAADASRLITELAEATGPTPATPATLS